MMIDRPLLAVGTPIHLDGYRGKVPHEHTPWLHAALTAAHGMGHQPPGGVGAMRPTWSLLPHDCESGWAAVWWDPADGLRLSGTSRPSRIGRRECVLRLGLPTRIHPPHQRGRGWHHLQIRATTPVSVARTGRDGHRDERPLPTSEALMHSLHGLSRKLRWYQGPAVEIEILRYQVRSSAVCLRGKAGRVGGWVGEVELRASASAAWLLEAAGRGLGLGSRTSYGLGRVHVQA
jgi:hypothetical protein